MYIKNPPSTIFMSRMQVLFYFISYNELINNTYNNIKVSVTSVINKPNLIKDRVQL